MEHANIGIRYVIITPAHNEQDLIANTIESVISQTIRPTRWVIVNDGSTDGTINLVESYLHEYEFIKFVDLKRAKGRDFGRKAIAFKRGLLEVQGLDYEYIGNLDADISISADYYEKILQEFRDDPRLGIGGGIVYSKIGTGFSTSDKTIGSVGGAVQMFRRSCFEAVGGYFPMEYGGIDAAAEIKARMLGWKVRKFPKLKVLEHRRTGSAQARPIIAKYREGRRFYSLGYWPPFYFMRCVYRTKDRPFFVGSLAAFFGFMESLIRRRPILIPNKVVRFLWKEQRQRILSSKPLKTKHFQGEIQ